VSHVSPFFSFADDVLYCRVLCWGCTLLYSTLLMMRSAHCWWCTVPFVDVAAPNRDCSTSKEQDEPCKRFVSFGWRRTTYICWVLHDKSSDSLCTSFTAVQNPGHWEDEEVTRAFLTALESLKKFPTKKSYLYLLVSVPIVTFKVTWWITSTQQGHSHNYCF